MELLLSDDILSELCDVLLRTEVQQRFPILSVEFVEAFLARLRNIGTLVDPVPSSFKFRRDPDDGRVKYLVTRDRDLLDIMESRDDNARQLRRACPDLRILDHVDLLRELVIKSK